MKHVEVGPEGAHLGYVELEGRGDVPPLVYLHGLGSCSPIYFARSAAEPVLAGRRVLMIDFLGFGMSDRPLSFGYTLVDHADAIARGLDRLGVAGADVIGHSMGGGVATLLADRRPDLVGRLVLAEPSLHPSPRPFVEPYTEDAFVEHGFALELSEVGTTWAATMRLADPVAMYRSEHALGADMPVLDGVLRALAMPRAVVEGDRSGWLRDDPDLRAAGIPVYVVTDAGHTMMLDNPTGFAHAVAQALAGMEACVA
ncbi:Pimeloyl-ACP methyl ester carboxylesterase [Sanguibacter gelidistatuariae]|uniref:Pimeloyl-ACP methyl ester carboxylesterase n=1 Tax=Sanguibacter gelidistatuariae TaxID=1814289 RepID=A0A1G6K3W5_9MICO|nr:alpha/beta hydrolase [Sanguibacter gelidistatuariae]SDC25719.1 Pimeloyl-ACP methyl ester carboxylesterase [Sanguibacter gelidistatuariae]